MLAGDNSKPAVSPRLKAPDGRLRLWTPIIRASNAAAVKSWFLRILTCGPMSARTVAWCLIGTITLRSTFFGPGRGQRLYGVVEAPRFSAGVLHSKGFFMPVQGSLCR